MLKNKRRGVVESSRPKLLKKLEMYGLSDLLTNWVKAFLTNRQQRVHLSGAYSDWLPVRSGVPQGSKIAASLFLIYINDIVKCVKHSTVKLFADDCKLYLSSLPEEGFALLNSDLLDILFINGSKNVNYR